jgi:hypothetical protein
MLAVAGILGQEIARPDVFWYDTYKVSSKAACGEACCHLAACTV